MEQYQTRDAKALLQETLDHAATSLRAVEGPWQSCMLVLFFAALFLILEWSMTHTPMAKVIAGWLRNNPKNTDKEVDKCVPLVATRAVGFIHNSFQVPIAVWAICHPLLRDDRLYATLPLSHWMLCIAGGFFLHDAISCYFREHPFYIIHGLTCCMGYSVAAVYGVAHFYGGLFLMWEISTPFVQLRWVLFKCGLTETVLYKINGLLMVLSFGIARIVFGTYFTFLLISDTYQDIRGGDKPPTAIWLGFDVAALTISSLNYYWFSLMLKTLVRIFFSGHSWTDASKDRRE